MAIELLERMTNKVGPLPAWAWAAIPAVAYIGWSYYKASQGDSTISDDTTDDTGAGDYGINAPGAYLPGYSTSPNGTSNLPYIDTPQYTNLTWSRQAINYLISEGVNVSDAITAVSAYINGYPTTLNSSQTQALQKAIAKLGPAPEGTSFVPGTNTTTPQIVPEKPTNMLATPLSPTSAKVTWGLPMKVNGTLLGWKVELYKFPVAGSTTWPLVKRTLQLPPIRTVTFSGLQQNTSYSFHVQARNAKGYGAYGQAPVHTPKVATASVSGPGLPQLRHPSPVT